MFYFRVCDKGLQQLFTRDFRPADDGDPQPSDFVISVSPGHYARITAAKPDSVYVRVYRDRYDTSLSNGTIFNEELIPVRPSDIAGNPVLLTITPDEFQAALAMRPAGE